MCLAIPAKVLDVDISNDSAKVLIGEVKKEISLSLVDDVKVGDYVLIHVGYALNKISEEEALATLKLFSEAGIVEIDNEELS